MYLLQDSPPRNGRRTTLVHGRKSEDGASGRDDRPILFLFSSLSACFLPFFADFAPQEEGTIRYGLKSSPILSFFGMIIGYPLGKITLIVGDPCRWTCATISSCMYISAIKIDMFLSQFPTSAPCYLYAARREYDTPDRPRRLFFILSWRPSIRARGFSILEVTQNHTRAIPVNRG